MRVRFPEVRGSQFLYLILLIAGAILRFANLAYPPLQDLEAVAALHAAPQTAELSGFVDLQLHQPAYETLTRIVFQLFGTSTANARLIPALAGLLLVVVPYLGRKRLGEGRSLFAAGLLAFSPIMVTLSRTASGASLGLLGLTVWLILSLTKTWPVLGAIGLGLALSSGPSVFTALVVLGLAGWLLRQREKGDGPGFNQGIWIVPVAVVALSTGLGTSMTGLSGFFDSLSEYLHGWIQLGSFSVLTLLAIFPVYAPALTLFSAFGIGRAIRDRNPVYLAAAFAAALGLVLVALYPGREPEDLGWIVLLLSFLAADALAGWVEGVLAEGLHAESTLTALGLLLLIGSLGVQIARVHADPQFAQRGLGLVVFMGALGGILVLLAIFGLGWDWKRTGLGLVFGAGAAGLLLSLSAIWHLSFRPYAAKGQELWRESVASEGLAILDKTLETMSEMKKGIEGAFSIYFYDPPPPAILWAIREQGIPVEKLTSEAPDVVLARVGDRDLNLPADYLGQTLDLGESWAWMTSLPPDLLSWWLDRSAPVAAQRWMVLFRQDLVIESDWSSAGGS